jgi:hypothetical protein
MSLTQAIDQCDLPALLTAHCGAEALRGLGPRGGTIRDPRPGKCERAPSFSVWRNTQGTWMWKKRGKNAGQGTAYTLLLSLGLSGPQVRAELLRLTGVQAPAFTPQRPPPSPVDLLTLAREKLAEVRPVTGRQIDDLIPRLTPLEPGDPAALELERRGLWPPGALEAARLGDELIFRVRGPGGRTYNFKRRNLKGERSYRVQFPGLGTPAWCSPGYGAQPRVLVVEGELNAVAAWRAITALNLPFDVQGLPGTDTWPFLEGLAGEMWLYADPDASGDGMRARLQDLAHALGGQVHQVPALPEGDFCDLLGRSGVHALGEALLRAPVSPAEEVLWPVTLEARAARASDRLLETRNFSAWPLMAP